jgi:hypothetical protein
MRALLVQRTLILQFSTLSICRGYRELVIDEC